MTESNTYCKKNPAECTDFELAIIRVRIGTFESESQLDLEHWENESRARVGALQTCQVSRIPRESHGFWQFLKAHGRETQCSRIFVNLTECCDQGLKKIVHATRL